MKIQPYNKNSKHKEAKETFAKQAPHNLYEQENEEENKEKRNTRDERINKNIKGYSFIIRKLMAWKKRIDLEEERIRKRKAELDFNERLLKMVDPKYLSKRGIVTNEEDLGEERASREEGRNKTEKGNRRLESPRRKEVFERQMTGEERWCEGIPVNIAKDSGQQSGVNSGASGSSVTRGKNGNNNNSGELRGDNNSNRNNADRAEGNDTRGIQIGQRLERDVNGDYLVGYEKRKIDKNHPPRIDRILTYSAGGYWLQVPQGHKYKGKWPSINVPLRVEPYREDKDAGDKEAKKACAYGGDAREMLCWYDFEEWKAHYSMYEIPTPQECTWMNGELFTKKVIRGRWGETEEEGEEEGDEEERGAGPSQRGRGAWSGYGRGQSRNYEEREFSQRGNRGGYRPRGRGFYRGGR